MIDFSLLLWLFLSSSRDERGGAVIVWRDRDDV